MSNGHLDHLGGNIDRNQGDGHSERYSAGRPAQLRWFVPGVVVDWVGTHLLEVVVCCMGEVVARNVCDTSDGSGRPPIAVSVQRRGPSVRLVVSDSGGPIT